MLQGWLSPLIRKHADAAGDPVADGELLARYADDRDESAFELLVWRHAALVAGVCQRILRDHHRAEDAFQAAFLVLARKAGSVRGNLGGWLFRVARRIALRAKQSAERTAAREVPLIDEAAREESITSIERTELLAILDEEVAGLPERFRLPVLLCYLGGNSTEEAARLLGCPRGTILSRLATARERLNARLTQRGAALPAGGFLTLLTIPTAASTARVVPIAVRQALAFRIAAAPANSPSQLLAQGVLTTMKMNRALAAAAAVLMSTGIIAGIGIVSAQAGPEEIVVAAEPLAKADPPRPEPPAKKDPREERIEKLKAVARSLQIRIRALEELLAVRTAAIEKQKRIQSQIDKMDADIGSLRREILELEIGIAIVKKRIAQGRIHIRQRGTTTSTFELNNLDRRLRDARQKLQDAKSVANGNSPLIEELSKKVDALTKEYAAEKEKLIKEDKESALKAAKQVLETQIEKSEDALEIKQATLDALTSRRDALAKESEEAARLLRNDRVDLDMLEVEREQVREIERRIAQETLEKLAPSPPAAADAKLELILTELRELRREVKELRSRKNP